METPFDYSQYSLEELYEVKRHINTEENPDTYASLLQEIAQKESQPPEPSLQAAISPLTPVVNFAWICLAIPFACLGLLWGYSGVDMIIHAWPAPGTRNDFEPWFSILVGSITLFVSWLCLTPAIAWFRRRKN